MPEFADPGLGRLAALQNFLRGALCIVVIGLILWVPGAIKARRMQVAGNTEFSLYRFIRDAFSTYPTMLSPVVMFLGWNPQLGRFAFIPMLPLAGIYGSIIHVFWQGEAPRGPGSRDRRASAHISNTSGYLDRGCETRR